MPLQIFVEDQITDSYEILALRALGFPTSRRNSRVVKASWIEIEELTTLAGLRDLSRRAARAGYDRIAFVLDQEGPRTPDRQKKLDQFREAFLDLCRELPSDSSLRHLKLIRIVCKCCLEGWLGADPQAVITSVRGRHGVRYQPEFRRTDELPPQQAVARVVKIIRSVGHELERQDLIHYSAKGIKSRGPSIAEHVDPQRARQYNHSLDYFFKMISSPLNGCEHLQPE